MKSSILILNNKPSERLAIEFYLARAKVDGYFFASEHEMENWLQHCLGDESEVVAAIVESTSLELSTHHLPCSAILASKEIPLIVAASSLDIADWCEISNPWWNSLSVYISPLTLLPELLTHIRRAKDQDQEKITSLPCRIRF